MSSLINFILAILIAAYLKGIDCNPVHVEKEINGVQRNVRVFKPDRKEWTHFHHSWGLPHFPSLPSVTSLFQDEDEVERIAMKKRLEELEKNQKEILALLHKLTNEISAKKEEPMAEPITEKPQTPILDDKKPMSEPSIEKVTTPKETEKESVPLVASTISLETVPSTSSSMSPSSSSSAVPPAVSPSISSTISSTISPTVLPIVSSTVSPSVSSIVVSTTIDSTETRAPVTDTISPQETSQEPRASSTSEEPSPPEPEQKEKVDPNSNPNTEDDQDSNDTAANEEDSTTVDTNSISIVAFSSDQKEEPAEETDTTL